MNENLLPWNAILCVHVVHLIVIQANDYVRIQGYLAIEIKKSDKGKNWEQSCKDH